MRLLNSLVLGAGITTVAATKTLKVAMVTDNHIGEGCGGDYSYEKCKPTRGLTDAVSKINEIGVDAVFVSGDMTDSALLDQFEKIREILDGLQMDWFPVLGNHDSWPYETHSDGTFNQTETAIGDQYFAQVFADKLATTTDPAANSIVLSWPTETCLNQDVNFQSWFHNYEVQFPKFSSSFRFLSLDWVARWPAWPSPGVGPQAELHDFDCGTMDWLDNKLDSISQTAPDATFFIVQHHPFHNRDSLDWFGNNIFFNFTFDKKQDSKVQDLLVKYFPVANYLGVQGGHMHRWYNGTAFNKYTATSEDFKHLPEFETPASKGWWVNEDYMSSFSLFTFTADDNDRVTLTNVEGKWKTPDGVWEDKPSVTNDNYGQ